MSNLRPCKACGKDVAKSAKVCPNCGQKLKMGFFAKMFLFGVGGLVVIIALATAASRGGKKDGNPDANNQPTNQSQNKGGAKPAAKIGDEIQFPGDSTWVVLDAEDKGNSLPSNNPLKKEANTDGKFVVIHFKVTNLGKKEQRLLMTPKVIDSQEREFKQFDQQSFYIPKGSKTMTMEAVPAGLPKEFYGVYEVPPDAKGLRFQTRDLTSNFSPDFKLVELGF